MNDRLIDLKKKKIRTCISHRYCISRNLFLKNEQLIGNFNQQIDNYFNKGLKYWLYSYKNGLFERNKQKSDKRQHVKNGEKFESINLNLNVNERRLYIFLETESLSEFYFIFVIFILSSEKKNY